MKITNGQQVKVISIDDQIPTGWYKGDVTNKGSSGKRWITNGSINKYITLNTQIPAGWCLGRILPKQSKNKTT